MPSWLQRISIGGNYESESTIHTYKTENSPRSAGKLHQLCQRQLKVTLQSKCAGCSHKHNFLQGNTTWVPVAYTIPGTPSRPPLALLCSSQRLSSVQLWHNTLWKPQINWRALRITNIQTGSFLCRERLWEYYIFSLEGKGEEVHSCCLSASRHHNTPLFIMCAKEMDMIRVKST